MRKLYITTSIPYVNADPHIGHALELIQADVIARYYRLLGSEVILQTGTDENAFKNVLAAKEQGITTAELVERHSGIFRKLVEQLDISADSFIRTTESRHRAGVYTLWQYLSVKDLYKKKYSGLYCYGCEDFLTTEDLVDNECPEHGKPPVRVDEKNYFFRLTNYTRNLIDVIEQNILTITPDTRKNEVLAFIKQGLKDISVSRDASRAKGWGIPVPGDSHQVIYVWIDALINYISGIGYGNGSGWQETWNPETKKIHVIGKNVWKFHAVYWPALLLSAGLPLPDEIFVHGFLTVDGKKISKSLGNVIDPFTCIKKYGTAAVRLYLLKEVSPFLDGDFSYTKLHNLYHSHLAHGIGNLVNRLTVLCEKATLRAISLQIDTKPPDTLNGYMKTCRFDKALEWLWQTIDRLNHSINNTKPWELLKQDSSQLLQEKLKEWIQELAVFGYWLSPFLPDTGKQIIDRFKRKPIKKAGPMFPGIG